MFMIVGFDCDCLTRVNGSNRLISFKPSDYLVNLDSPSAVNIDKTQQHQPGVVNIPGKA